MNRIPAATGTHARRLLAAVSLAAVTAWACPSIARGQDSALPTELQDVTIEQKLGDALPADVALIDEQGRQVRLSDYLGKRPVLLNFVYYECPMLCTLVLNGVVRALRTMEFEPGKEFEIVTVSIDPRETPALARMKKDQYLESYGRPGAEASWHFLTAPQESIDRLTKAAGFRYRWDEESKQFVHAAGIMLLTPDGRMHRYFYGVEFAPRDLRLGMVEAAQGRIGTRADALMLFCFHYDPVTGRYGLAIMTLVRTLGLGMALVVASFIALMLRRDRRRAVAGGGAA